MPVQFRQARPDDAEVCGRVCYEAFAAINNAHNFPPDFPDVSTAVGLLSIIFAHPGFYSVVAERDGRIVGSNVLDERSAIAGVGPITVDPNVQNVGVGRDLMLHVMERARSRNYPGVRLVQAAFHNRSLSLYTKLGFDVREPLSCIQGTPLGKTLPGFEVRAAVDHDIAACNSICNAVHGHTREGELRDAIAMGSANVAQRAGEIVGYATGIAFFAHAVAESNAALKALIAAAPVFAGPGFLVPTRNAELMRWCLGNGLRVVQPMSLMSVGLYNEPRGACLPSIAF